MVFLRLILVSALLHSVRAACECSCAGPDADITIDGHCSPDACADALGPCDEGRRKWTADDPSSRLMGELVAGLLTLLFICALCLSIRWVQRRHFAAIVRNSVAEQGLPPPGGGGLLPPYAGRHGGSSVIIPTAPTAEQQHLAATYPPGQAYSYLLQTSEPPTEPPPAYVRDPPGIV
ncbi:hypothetical protein BDZ88DRAFT_412957, partial [Geranomyces variabilis]